MSNYAFKLGKELLFLVFERKIQLSLQGSFSYPLPSCIRLLMERETSVNTATPLGQSPPLLANRKNNPMTVVF